MNNFEIVKKASELLKENLEWDERYANYAKKIDLDQYARDRKKFRIPSPLNIYSSISRVEKCTKYTTSYDLRHQGQSIGEITVKNGEVYLNTKGKKESNSKYFKYDEASAKKVILDYEKYGVPLDNMVLDTDWRAASDRGIGYDVDTSLFPDLKRFTDFAHSRGVQIVFNDHPEPLEGAESVFSPEEIAFREEKLQDILALGLDMWWYDRNWSTKLKSPTAGVKAETLGMYLFSQITDHFYRKKAEKGRYSRRPWGFR